MCTAEHDSDGNHAPTLGEPREDSLNDARDPKKHADQGQDVDRNDRSWTESVEVPVLEDVLTVALEGLGPSGAPKEQWPES